MTQLRDLPDDILTVVAQLLPPNDRLSMVVCVDGVCERLIAATKIQQAWLWLLHKRKYKIDFFTPAKLVGYGRYHAAEFDYVVDVHLGNGFMNYDNVTTLNWTSDGKKTVIYECHYIWRGTDYVPGTYVQQIVSAIRLHMLKKLTE